MKGLKVGRPRLAMTLLLAMLGVALLAILSTFLFANLAVQREMRKLPPEVQAYLRAQQAAARQGQVMAPAPPTPIIRTGSAVDAYLPDNVSSPGVNGVIHGPDGLTISVLNGQRELPTGSSGGRVWIPPEVSRSQDFQRNIQSSLLELGLLSALASALLAWWLARRLARPITAVSGAAQQLARGQLNARAPVLSSDREIVELADSFNDMASNLERLENERQQAVADIAHELRTPLAVMQARLDALEDGVYPLNDAQVKLLSDQTQLLTRLVGDLRTLTLADAGQLTLAMQPTHLDSLVAQVVGGQQDRAGRLGIQLNLSASPAELLADRDRLRQVISNLIDNALRHARTQVQVSVLTSPDHLDLLVDDDGSGIPEAHRAQVFTRFTRLDESRTRDTGGSGLGLAIVQTLTAAHGGSVKAEGSPLGGARFRVSLPAAPLS